jgi:signal transduction histidine kinase
VLQGVQGLADLAAALAARNDNTRLNGTLASITQAVTMGTGLVRKLSGFSVRTKRFTTACDLREVLQGTVVLLKPVLGSAIQLEIDADSACWSVVDKTDFEQVVLNLCLNARDAIRTHTRQGGSISITLGERDVESATCSSCGNGFSGRFVMLTAKDNGGGIPAQTMKRMFDPFYTTKPEGKGSGLGLSIVHSVVHTAAGHLCVESAEGQGTTFTVFLPRSGTIN